MLSVQEMRPDNNACVSGSQAKAYHSAAGRNQATWFEGFLSASQITKGIIKTSGNSIGCQMEAAG